MPNQPIDELLREMYARFGLAYYHSEVLHRGLCIIHAMSGLPHRNLLTRPRVEERLAHAFSLTLGDVIKELGGKLLEEFAERLDEAVTKRNVLAHHFWFSRAHKMFQADQIEELITELDGYTELFNRLDEDTSAWFRTRHAQLGLADDILQDSLARILSRQDEVALHGKDAVRQIEKKLKGIQRLVRVWEFELPEGGKPLVFEMEDGTFWQLCDVGLGWTRFQQTESHWVEHPTIKPFLPADIAPRPKDVKPFKYEFKLKRSAVLWVKPGRRPQTFQWGIRTRTGGTEQDKSSVRGKPRC